MVEVAFEHRSILAEGPIWDAEGQTICWIDIQKGEIHQLNLRTNDFTSLGMDQMIGAIALCTNGDFLVALQNGLGRVNRRSGELKMLVDPEFHLPGNRFNDGKCDPQGRFWAGTMSLKEEPKAGSVYMFDSNHKVETKVDDTNISNGMAWSLDHKLFYFIDTPTFQVVAYDYEQTSGAIGNRRVVIDIAKQEGYPDGMTIDSEGMLWIAHWNGGQVTRWDPLKGEKLFSLALPVDKVTSCVFGGEGLRDLYITTAQQGLSEQEIQEQPLAGSLFVWRNCGYQGVPAYLCNC